MTAGESSAVPTAASRVLPTMNLDGSRYRIRPRLARGRFLNRRRIVGYALIALFVALPFLEIGGRPALLLDLATRELSLFGAVFRPSDGVLLMFLGLTVALVVFLVTALLGRVWCGYGCPQTVYLELVFRPIERLFEGGPAEQRRRDGKRPDLRRIAKWITFGVLAFAVANVFLAYFVGVDRLALWVLGSPADHPIGFTIVVAVAVLMFADFAWFREQTCIVACPYGRLQTVLLDRQSLIVGYDRGRGEPRGKPKKSLRVLDQASLGDCVDCGACVAVCPTGIDIRDGLQMECIGCAQCIDACDPIMAKVGKPAGLIRYASQDELAGKPRRLLRARTIIYPVLLAVALAGLVLGVSGRGTADVSVMRYSGTPFQLTAGGEVVTTLQIKVENRSGVEHRYRVELIDRADARLLSGDQGFEARPGHTALIPVVVASPRDAFPGGGRRARLRITDGDGFDRTVDVVIAGPERAP
jgi:cytochrome c oxidase accessory protein FixG